MLARGRAGRPRAAALSGLALRRTADGFLRGALSGMFGDQMIGAAKTDGRGPTPADEGEGHGHPPPLAARAEGRAASGWHAGGPAVTHWARHSISCCRGLAGVASAGPGVPHERYRAAVRTRRPSAYGQGTGHATRGPCPVDHKPDPRRTGPATSRRRNGERPRPSLRRSTRRRCSRAACSGTSGSRNAPRRRAPAQGSPRPSGGCPGSGCW